MLDAFDFAPRTRIVFGQGALAALGRLARELLLPSDARGASRVLLVTDPGLVAAGHAGRAESVLRAEGLEVERFAEVRENPNAEDVEACARAARDWRPAVFVGLGGGSAIDVAKGADFLLTNGGRMQDYWGFGKTSAPLLPLVAVPTTAGTGSEVQSYALIADEHSHQKMACGAADAAPRIALLDPELTLTQPFFVTACTGLDAIGHAVETAVTTRRNPLSSLFSREAFRLACASFPAVLRAPEDLAARGKMLQAAAFAGLAIEHSMLGAAHSMANPLTARMGLAHGQAVALALPHVVRFNAEDPVARGLYAELAWNAGLADRSRGEGEAVEVLAETLVSFLRLAGFATAIASPGTPAERGVDLEALAEEAARQWTARFNPRPVEAEDFRHLFAEACRPGSGTAC